MASSKSSFLPRLSFSRGGDAPVLPFHNKTRRNKNPSEYDLSELSPKPEDGLLSPVWNDGNFNESNNSYRRGTSTPSAVPSERGSTAGSTSKMKPRVLFAGPPPPIAASQMMLYKDIEDRRSSTPTSADGRPNQTDAISSTRQSLRSVLFDRIAAPPKPKDRNSTIPADPDSVWRSLQRRERALQKDLQHFLDVQSAGLAAYLDPNHQPTATPSSRSDASDAGSSTPTGTFYSTASTMRSSRLHGSSTMLQPARASASGPAVVPVRQPRRRPLDLRSARAGLARAMSALADLKAEEDASLDSALTARRHALAQLGRLATRRDGVAAELRVLEDDADEPLARELHELRAEHEVVSAEVAELEARLVSLRNRKRWLEGRIEDVGNRREAGLSGYRGALREVEGQVAAILRRPPVRPLDVEVLRPEEGGRGGGEDDANGHVDDTSSPGGLEFLRMRPERRTVDMAKDWWEAEVVLLERRKAEVDRGRAALEEGAEVWKEAVKLVSDFERGLRNELKGNVHGGHDNTEGKGKERVPDPVDAMRGQLDKMRAVMAGLEQRLSIAEVKGWNLLICAIGAEYEAFREAHRMLGDTLIAAGFDVDINESADHAPQITRRTSSPLGANGQLVDVVEEDKGTESDNEVPSDLLTGGDADPGDGLAGTEEAGFPRPPEREDSENEIPPEFLAEQIGEDDDVE